MTAPPPLTASLSANFNAVAALFTMPVLVAPAVSVTALRVPPVTAPSSFAPHSPVLTQLWEDEPDLYSFLLISISSFSRKRDPNSMPSFPAAQAGSAGLTPAFYSITNQSLSVYRDKKWHVVCPLTIEDFALLTPRRGKEPLFFRIV